jgi:hypothetical protein
LKAVLITARSISSSPMNAVASAARAVQGRHQSPLGVCVLKKDLAISGNMPQRPPNHVGQYRIARCGRASTARAGGGHPRDTARACVAGGITRVNRRGPRAMRAATPGLVLLALLASFAACTAVQQQQQQHFAVDLGAVERRPFDNTAVTRCFGSSHAATAMRADWQRELTQVQKDLGAEYVRFHGLLDDDMSVVVPGHAPRKPDDSDAPLYASPCKFVEHQDFKDMGANVVNASSKEECCHKCLTEPTGLPEPCVAAVFTSSGQCYFKIGDDKPVMKPSQGIFACITDRTSAKQYQYSWSNIFTVFDFLRSINMRPIIEVSFMPELLASYTNKTVFHYKGIQSPPKSFAAWRDFMTAFGTALVERYTLAEVSQWYFEVCILQVPLTLC